MKVFRGKRTEIMCPGCERWVPLQKLRLVRKIALPAHLSDRKDATQFKRTYECPFCQAFVLRCPK